MEVKKICEIDGKTFVDSKSIHHHQNVTHKSTEKNKDCSLCNKSFFSQRDLTTHIKKDQHSEILFDCLKCDKFYTKRANLNAHVKCHVNKRKANRENYEKKLRVHK